MPEFKFKKTGKGLELKLGGSLVTGNTAGVWKKAIRQLEKKKPAFLLVNAEKVDYMDSTGISFLVNIREVQERRGGDCELVGLKEQFLELCELMNPGELPKREEKRTGVGEFVNKTGAIAVEIVKDVRDHIGFIGEITAKLVKVFFRPGSLRLKDTIGYAETAGADAFGITALLGFLVGLILAFQSAIPLSRFGVQLFVADIVSISMFRELGPLLTAFILASRSSSAFAAEIGTMKINEEIDAMKTMGIDPMVFLAIPRIIAAVFITPLLTMVNNLFGILGLAVVMSSLGFARITYVNQIRNAVRMEDFIGGLAKTFVFGFLIALIGCMRGIQTKKGPRAVGESATSAVVTSIVAIIIVDGIFAVVYYILGI